MAIQNPPPGYHSVPPYRGMYDSAAALEVY